MEYPMATLITGNRKLPSLVGVTVHEAAHSWYQGVLATNESLYPWMDEGFTSYASAEVMDQLFASPAANPHDNAYADYSSLATDGKEEVLSTHADHYNTNHAYGSASYSKGEVYLAQLGYIVGEEMLDQIILRYFETWKFKHPDANDFIRVAEKESGMVLDWYNEYFVNTTKTIDYAISGLMSTDQKTEVVIERKGLIPMPLEVEVVYTDQTKELFYLPLDIMRGEKKMKGYNGKWTIISDVNWVKENIVVTINKPSKAIESITIDPTDTMADIDRSNNSVQLEQGIQLLMINR
jgi:aminopeptidase N